ncbi:hypothetical protein [Pseudomonas sp. URMO17WK12:I2]|uniref:hypothetical protein n=1 Tax=Pseudomonas sp. URMO17WK12:I2 TaxID=1261623 RepID=UPI000DAF3527|nr:hypothetical protein [Pseudomonas sp. URMO17WK12:I2]
MNDADRDGHRQSCGANEQAVLHDVPLGPNKFILAIEAVRGPGAALALLREHLQLRPSARLVFSSYGGCYFLRLDDVDRFENRRVGQLEAVSIMPFKAGEIFRNEVSTWTAADVAGVEDAEGVGAGQVASRWFGFTGPTKVGKAHRGL